MGTDYDEIIRRMLGQTSGNDFSSDLSIQPGLMSQTQVQSGNDSAQTLGELHQKNEANMQSMQQIGQDAIRQGMQASQTLQAQRQAQMDVASQQAAQALEQAKQRSGNLFGMLLSHFI